MTPIRAGSRKLQHGGLCGSLRFLLKAVFYLAQLQYLKNHFSKEYFHGDVLSCCSIEAHVFIYPMIYFSLLSVEVFFLLSIFLSACPCILSFVEAGHSWCHKGHFNFKSIRPVSQSVSQFVSHFFRVRVSSNGIHRAAEPIKTDDLGVALENLSDSATVTSLQLKRSHSDATSCDPSSSCSAPHSPCHLLRPPRHSPNNGVTLSCRRRRRRAPKTGACL